MLIISKLDEGSRLDVYLAEQYSEYSRSYIQKLIKNELIKVNNKLEKNRYILKENDEIEIIIPTITEKEIMPQNIPLDIIYEDNDIIVLNKPQGMVVHPATSHYENTLVNALLYYYKDQLSSINGKLRPGIVHRIDMDTSGLLMIAKNNDAHLFLAQQLKNRTVLRKYHAIVLGNIKEDEFTIDAPIARHPVQRLKMTVSEDGRRAITHIKVIERLDNYTYVEAKLETGRTHQIRVHLSHINNPILGDEIYGGVTKKFNLDGQVLHAKTLGFIHPSTKEYMEFDSSLPENFKKVLRSLNNEIAN
ncbi:MAG: RluA family pseudouridine synthase [Clostridiales bacterium]|nr:RluA family pseudouridine synthase [Clostridiales bacterium]